MVKEHVKPENEQMDEKVSIPQNKQLKSHSHRKLFILLGSVSTLAGGITGAGLYLMNKYAESAEIGKAFGEYIEQVNAEQNELKQKTLEASKNRAKYQKECKEMAHLVCNLAKKHNGKTPEWIIDTACTFFGAGHKNDPKRAIVIEDMKTIKKHFRGNTKDLRNMMCYYHTSPEVKFLNRYSKSFEAADSIYRYELKVRRYLFEKYGEARKSMFEK